ncbi:hypothetical protein ACIUXL_24355 [Pseudomonas aeruginosa]
MSNEDWNELDESYRSALSGALETAHPAVEQAGGDERAAFELFVRKHCGMPEHIAVNWDAKFTNDAWEGWQARAALAQPSPDAPYADDIAADLERSDWTPEDALRWYAAGKHFDTVNGRTRIIDTGAVASNALKHLSLPYLEMKGDAELTELREAMAQPSPVRSSLLINGYQLRAALDFIAPDGTAEQLESEACIEWRQQDADFLEAGLYAFCAEYPEEGSVLLDEEPTTAQPSPLQSEQAEAERPEVAEVAFVLRNIGAMDAEDIDGDNVDLRFEDAEGRDTGCDVSIVEYAEKAADLFEQHDRIVGALRAENAKLSEALDRWPLIRDSLKLRLADALARVAELEAKLSDPTAVHQWQFSNAWFDCSKEALLKAGKEGSPIRTLYTAPAQAQHSVPEGWKPVPIEPLLNMMSDKDHDTRIMAERQLLSILADAPGKEVPQAWLDVQAERRRQITAEGWTPEHDDEHDSGELAAAGAAYALHAADHLNPYSQGDGGDEAPSCWPWHDGIAGRGEGPEKTEPAWWKPSTPRRDLVKACALALAEIERLDRAAPGKEGV